MSKRKFSILSAVVIIAAILIVSALGSTITRAGLPWYATLAKPGYTPPGVVISTAWTLIYIFSGIAAWRVWNLHRPAATRPVIILTVANLILNVGWSFTFFGLHRPWLAVPVCVAIGVTVGMIALSIRRHDKASAWLLAPYVGWVCFATFLNSHIAALN